MKFEKLDAPLVENERPKMDAMTHKLIVQSRRNPTEADKQALLERMGTRYDKVWQERRTNSGNWNVRQKLTI